MSAARRTVGGMTNQVQPVVEHDVLDEPCPRCGSTTVRCVVMVLRAVTSIECGGCSRRRLRSRRPALRLPRVRLRVGRARARPHELSGGCSRAVLRLWITGRPRQCARLGSIACRVARARQRSRPSLRRCAGRWGECSLLVSAGAPAPLAPTPALAPGDRRGADFASDEEALAAAEAAYERTSVCVGRCGRWRSRMPSG